MSKQVVEFKMSYIKLQSSTGCTADAVVLYDATTATAAEQLVVYCGTQKGSTHRTVGKSALLRFFTDNLTQNLGFKAFYSLLSTTTRKWSLPNM